VEAVVECAIILGLILVNGFFAGAEIAVLTARRSRLEQAAEGGSRAAKAALALLSDPSRFLSTVQVGITGVGTFAAAYGGVSLVAKLESRFHASSLPLVAQHGEGIALALVGGTIAFASLVLGELIPKRVALAFAEPLAQLVAVPMLFLSTIARPLVAGLGLLTTGVLRAFRIDPELETAVSLADIEHLVEEGREQGLLQSTEHDVLLETLQLGRRRVRDIMRPRIDIDAVDVETLPEEVAGVAAMSGFSRLPVYEGDLDHVVGFIYNKDLLLELHLKRKIELRRMLRQPLFIPENLTLERLLVLFRERHAQLAIVLDEFGGTEGLVTIEDVLEEIVGEIHDEHRHDESQMIVPRADGTWLVDGQLRLHELLEQLPPGTRLPAKTTEANSVAGLVLEQLGVLPKAGDVVTYGDVRIEVADMDGFRVDRLLVSVASAPIDSEANN
jgi:putative hemolysin